MTNMELSLAEGWTQVSPRETRYELLLSGQSPGQRLLVTDTAFVGQKDLGFSGGINCPLAVDEAGGRIFVSADGILSLNVRENEQREDKINEDISAVWMLEYVPSGPELLMHLFGDDPKERFIARLNLRSQRVSKEQLPSNAFSPLDVSQAKDKVLYSTGKGAAVYDVGGRLQTCAAVDLPFQPAGGVFDVDDHSVLLGGNGIFGWKTKTGEVSHLCDSGSHPAIDGDGDVWFSLRDGALAKLHGNEARSSIIVELAGMDTTSAKGGSYAMSANFSPDGRFCLATLTGKTDLPPKELEDAEAFCVKVGQPFSDTFRYNYHHYFCVLDLGKREVWCHEGFAHNVAWIERDYFG